MKLTICAYDWPAYAGGPNVWLRRLLPALRVRGIDSHVLFMTADPMQTPTLTALVAQGFQCSMFPFGAYTEDRVEWIAKQVEAQSPDVFIPNLAVPAYYAVRWVRQLGIPSVGVLHSDDTFHWDLVREFAGDDPRYRVSAFTGVSQYICNKAANLAHSAVRVEYIPYGVPVPDVRATVPAGTLKLVFAGRLVEEQKRISELTAALCAAVHSIRSVEAALIGDGPGRASVENIIREAGVGDSVRVLDAVDATEIQQVLAQSHVIVLLSDYEGLPISLLDAMACGVVPVCLSTASGIPQLISDRVTGLTVLDRGEDFVRAIRELHEHPDLWNAMSLRARQLVQANYSEEAVADHWQEFLTRIVSDNRGRDPHRRHMPVSLSLPQPRESFAREDVRRPTRSRAVWRTVGSHLPVFVKRRLRAVAHRGD